MSNTKKKILTTAQSLFNKLGYSQVTIRMIALELKMSSGNLNYHFRKRENILEALYFEMVSEFDTRVKRLDQISITLQKIKEDIQTSMSRMVEYKFFWTDLFHLLSLNEKINAHFQKAFQDRLKGYQFLFKVLLDDRILKRVNFQKEHEFLIRRMIDFSNTWLYASSLYQKNNLDQAYIEQQADILISMLYPYLTDNGKKDFENLIPGSFT